MKKKFLTLTASIAAACTVSLSAKPSIETIMIDSPLFQSYHGFLGRWIYAADNKTIASHLLEFSSCEQETSVLNRNSLSGYLFIPYGSSYIDHMRINGIAPHRRSISPGSWIWPVDASIIITSRYGMRGGELHEGIDIPAQRGEAVRAADDGFISFTGFDNGYGNMIDISHDDGYLTRYGHNAAILVRHNDIVRKGQIIALAGSTGNSTGCHVHFEIRRDGTALDPFEFLPGGSNERIRPVK